MNRIVIKRTLTTHVKLFEVEGPAIAKKAEPGQFVVLRIDEKGERIPLTIVDSNPKEGTIILIVQEVGKTTKKLGMMKEEDEIATIVGPLGNPSEIKKYGQVVVIGGGVAIAMAYPEAKALKEAGNKVICIIGARNKDLLFFEEEMRQVSDELHITTDDGTKGRKGFVTDVLKELISQKKIDLVSAIGPTIMMKVVSEVTRPHEIKTFVSLNPIMLDGTGMCGVCRVTVGGETKFACVDGPAFDGHLVDFDELMARQKIYLEKERISMERYEKQCN